MKAIRVERPGDVQVLQVADMPKPKPGRGEALIHLREAGLNFVDIYQRSGKYQHPIPFIPGLEGAGVVEEVGEDVREVKPGDRVAYPQGPGSYAEYNVVKAWELIPLPKEIDFEQGAAFPLQGLTAHYLTHDHYQIKKDDVVLVHAASGGVGLQAVQWAKHLGARVVGTVSTEEKADIARQAGADWVILYTQHDFAEETKKLTGGIGVDYIIDGVGKSTFNKDLDAVETGGWICVFGSSSGLSDPVSPNAYMQKSITVSGGMLANYIRSRDELLRRSNDIFNGIREGWLKLKIDHVYPLEQAAEAQASLENRKTSGKVILKINEE